MIKVSPLLVEMFKRENIEEAIEHCVDKGINKTELRKLKNSDKLIEIYVNIRDGKKTFKPSHQAAIPKGDGTDRIVYVGDTCERFICSLINNALFKCCGELIHPANKAYTKGLGTGSSVQEFSRIWAKNYGKYYVVKGDFHHYFDDISKEKVYWIIDKIEKHLGFEKGTEPVCNLMRQMYDNDYLFDINMNLIEKWSGIRQGNAIASFMANAMLYELDEYMTNKYPYYVRYSDDSITLCTNPDEVKEDMNRIIANYGITMNEKKFKIVSDEFIKFLGFNVNGSQISLSKSRTKDLWDDVYDAIKDCHSERQALNKINRLLYKGNGEYSWGTSCLPIINVERDIDTLNELFMDCIRVAAINTNKKRQIKRKEIGGIGVETKHSDYTMIRGKGSRVKTAKERTDKDIEGYKSLRCMINAILNGSNAYRSVVYDLDINVAKRKEKCSATYEPMTTEECLEIIEDLYREYKYSLPCERSERCKKMFYALPVDDLSIEQMCIGKPRLEAMEELEDFVLGNIKNGNLKWNDAWGNWFYVGNDRDFVMLKEWFD